MRDNRIIIVDNFASAEDCALLESKFEQEDWKPVEFKYAEMTDWKLGPGPKELVQKYEDMNFHPDVSCDFVSLEKPHDPAWDPWIKKVTDELYKNFAGDFEHPLEYCRASTVRTHGGTGYYMHYDKASIDNQLFDEGIARGEDPEALKAQVYANRSPKFTGILYLNDTEGGELIIDGVGKFQPKAGRLIMFESSHFYHGIEYIKNYRHTLLVWIEQAIKE